jgi:phytoene desaturase
MADVVVVGSGVGGLCAAIRLCAAGHEVTVLERNDVPGGKLAERVRDGFTFDTGPSLVTLPHVFDEVLALAGTSLGAEVDLVRLDPQFRYWWPDGSHFDVPDGADAAAAAMEAFAPGAGAAWRRFDAHGRRIWDVSERTFFAGPMDHPVHLARRMRSPRDLVDIDPLRSLATLARSMFGDPRLVQWAGRYATYSGSSPYRAPATLACIPHVEQRCGVWYPMGGLGRLLDALVRAAVSVGVEVRCASDVVAIEADDERVKGVRLVGGERLPAAVVVANVDAEHLYADLLADRAVLRRVRRAERSSSGFVVLAGVDGPTDGISHHTVWFSADYQREFRQLFDERVPATDPTVYACVSSVTDPSQAPAGAENWFLLVNAPAGGSTDWDRAGASYAEHVLDVLAGRGVRLAGRLRFTEVLTPADLEQRYRTPDGSIYGTSSNGPRAAFARPANRGARRGLYLVGGSSHPGGGLPLVATSARIVAGMVAEDGW